MTTTENALLHRLAALDPANQRAATSRETVEHTRRWVLAHDRPGATDPMDPPAAPGVAGLVTMLEREPGARQRRPVRTAARRRPVGRRLALAGAAAVVVLGTIGVLPSAFAPEVATPPAAAIPMLAYSEPAGIDGPTTLHALAEQLRASSGGDGSGRYYFEHRQRVGYSMHEVEVSEGYWEVDSLVFTEDRSFRWYDTTDLSGGQLYVRDDGTAVEAWETILGVGEGPSGPVDVPESPQAVLDAVMANNDQHQRHPGYYLIDAYAFQANQQDQGERATFLEAIALAGDVTSYGSVTDREGREGVAFGATRVEDHEGGSVEIESVMVLDPATGKVLEVDTIYPNDLPGAPDVVEEYTIVIESRYTDTLPPCGDQACPGAEGAVG